MQRIVAGLNFERNDDKRAFPRLGSCRRQSNEDVNETPYTPPLATEPAAQSPQPGRGEPLTRAVIGFALGTLIVSPFVLSGELEMNLAGGAI
jgi:hypothetical protein